MTRLLLALAAAGAAFTATGAANACTLQTCPGTSIVCSAVRCEVPDLYCLTYHAGEYCPPPT
jgi:hypothetical protein